MTKHKIVHFQLAPSGVALVIAGAVLIGALLVVAGYIAGSRHDPAPAPAAEAFALRVKTVASEDEAKTAQAELKAKGVDAAIVALPPEGGAASYALDTGRYATRREAADASAALAEKSGVETVVVAAHLSH